MQNGFDAAATGSALCIFVEQTVRWATDARDGFPLPFGRGEGQGEGILENTPTGRRFPLPSNRKVGLGVLTPPPSMLDTLNGRGGVRTPSPTCLWRFRDSRRESFRRILTPALSPIVEERENRANAIVFCRSARHFLSNSSFAL